MDRTKSAFDSYGLRHEVTKEVIRDSIKRDTVEKYLQKVPVKKNDVFYIEAGMIHAIGAGVLIAEIQESSNVTYRLYDYGRVDQHGKKRELHIEKALEVANLNGNAEPVQPLRVLKYYRECASEFLCRCKYFQVERLLLNTERCKEMVDFQTGEMSFSVLLCLDGCGVLFFEEETIRFFKGDSIFVPAHSVLIKIHGNAQLLKVSC